jgi:triosephosphate isomerase
MRQLIAGNWKMNGTLELAEAITKPLRSLAHDLPFDIVICPPATLVNAVAHMLVGAPVGVGGQTCDADPFGAHTGDLSATMLREAGATWVILGHSERRATHGETDDQVRRKVLAARKSGLTPIVCVGETQEQRSARKQTEVVGWQIEGSLPKDFAGVLAYEPVWAIGTGHLPTIAEVGDMHGFIREELHRQLGAETASRIRVLYGGSVNPANAASLLAIPEVGGALIGGASLLPEPFMAIVHAAAALSNPAAHG